MSDVCLALAGARALPGPRGVRHARWWQVMAQPSLQKRRHPDGFVLWDVFVDGRRVGLVRQHAVAAPSWFAYTATSDEPIGRYPFRRDAVAALLEAGS